MNNRSDGVAPAVAPEHRVKDKGKWAWLQIGSRPNHYFDCEAMQTAAATMLKLIGREAAQIEDTDSTVPDSRTP